MKLSTTVLMALLAITLIFAPCSARLVATSNTEYTRIQFAAHVATTKSISLSAAETLVKTLEQAAGGSARFSYG